MKELGARASWRRAIDVVQWLASREGGATRADKYVAADGKRRMGGWEDGW